ncbi:NmrA family NAD(P)-binding protein [Bradyrhizobium japonicum]|uniref:NmrA family NAD(P)-binding protein n=1 Tax=Bradyrhizobium japonicum TaxID=375 RepID=UPI00057DA871|nr:NmrA family NAD(P)-binding protein [Bradyrhizobium japonicum]MCD9111661.1 NmrA family NAD(P)-binding protein [Bradyrhizobium japonicum]MCD9255730.1 NmrA family NAD(P)-binding protein [Bradyrhizobium japonicum SEMIA 5079]MCD9822762.1 NmrA family NAD(P)-binding protein [Bradyrhizobium japonicum]MCD9893539.1 NmrA family NAD(P)-binding protein [Bradyrhizobium japonicum]MCD9909460.1 NmrA family NAD(P)-binding protein [Bradyrhizobium japonicum]
MAERLFLISGATGTTGRVALAELINRGHRVRALVHHEDARAEHLRSVGAETTIGDLLDLDQVRAAMDGVEGGYFVYPFRDGLVDAAARFAQAAREAGVKSIVNMSQRSARRDARSRAARDHFICEQLFDWSGIPTTHIRPTFFAEWLIYNLPGWRVKEGVIRFPLASGRHAPIAGEDQGRVVAGLLENPDGHEGKVYPLFGPIELDHHQIAEKLTATLGRKFSYQPMTISDFRSLMEGAEMNPRFIQHIQAVAQDYQDGIFAGTNDIVERITGRKPLSIEQFVGINRAKFRR